MKFLQNLFYLLVAAFMIGKRSERNLEKMKAAAWDSMMQTLKESRKQ